MKKTLSILSVFWMSINFISSQELTQENLIGEWTFIELQDEKGSKLTEIPLTRFGQNRGVEKVNRDSYILKKD